MELKELYQEIILDHAKNPRNKGICSEYNHDAKAHNPLCGDKVHIYLKLEKDKNISNLSFEGEGCAISLASASILTDTLKGKDLNFSKKVTDDFLKMLKNKSKISVNSLTQGSNYYHLLFIWCSRISYANKMCHYGLACTFISFRKKR